jgi:uncharacterized protein involved in high-affinity Fe2+ transport
MRPLILTVIALSGLAILVTSAGAGEQRIGEAVRTNGMEITAVYLQPVKMLPDTSDPVAPDIHLEADIRGGEANANGFGVGEWIPYLAVAYRIEKQGSDWQTAGLFVPMMASDGPHYGANVGLDGPGKYHLTYHVAPPVAQGLFRHVDRETGVAEWWAPFSVEWDFVFVGTGKKGGY